MTPPVPYDPKAGEKTYYRQLDEAGRSHARAKPFSDGDCGKYLCDIGALLLMLEAPPRTVLDLGCGTGWTSRFLAKAGYRVTGLDISEDAVRIAREVSEEEGVENVAYSSGDYESFEPAQLFDYALFYDALHHAEDEAAALQAAYRALKPGGVLFAFEPGKGHSRSAGARHAVETYGVHEKDMSPAYVWSLARRIGFRRKLFLPKPQELCRAVYRKDYLRASGSGVKLWAEKAWGYFRACTKSASAPRKGLVILWK